MRYYLASRFSRRGEMRQYRSVLDELLGHECTAQWIDEGEQSDQIDAEAAEKAIRDVNDIRRADCLIAFAEKDPRGCHSRGGRIFEAGLAFGLHKRLILVGMPEHIFHGLDAFEIVPDFSALFSLLASERLARRSKAV